MRSISLVLAALLMTNCTTIQCEAFDLDKGIVDYFFFPEFEPSYAFVSDRNDTMIYDRLVYETTEAYENKCHMCSCTQKLDVSYEQRDGSNQLSNYAIYDSHLFPDSEGSTNYDINGLIATVYVEADTLTESQYSDISQEKIFELKKGVELDLGDTIYTDLIELSLIEKQDNAINILWIKESVGLIAYSHSQTIWKLN